MALYEVELTDGRTVQVEAPPGATDEQLSQIIFGGSPTLAERRAANKQALDAQREELYRRRAASAEKRRREESGFLENALTGFGSGAVGVGELAATGAAALLDEENELAARDRIQSLAEAIRPEGGDPESVTYKLFSGLGSIAGIGAPALAAAAAAPAAAAGAVGLGTATALGMGAGAGEARERARAAGLTGEELTGPTVGGTFIGSLEGLPVVRPLAAIGRALRIPGLASVGERLATKIDAETVAGRLAQRGKSAGITGTAEGAQEGAAAILQNLVERGYNPAKELVDAGVIEESLIGGGAGAILQGLTDFLVRGRPRGATPDTEGRGELDEQLEMFPEEDLGTRPEAPAAEPEDVESQLEMFTPEEMGRPPERPDERQLDLFGAREPDMGPEPEQGSFDVELDDRRIEAEARERLALAAAERGDEAAFDQPDLFPLELEQTERRLGRQPVEEARVEEPTPTAPAGEQLDILTAIEEETQLQQMQEEETAALEQRRAEEGAQRARQARLQVESELESLEGRRLSAQERATEERRRGILLDTIEATPSRNYTTVSRAYTRALQEQGFRDTAPTEQEVATIQRAVNVQQAIEAPLEQIEAAPEATQLSELEALVSRRRSRGVAPTPEAAQVTPTETALEGPSDGRPADRPAAPAPQNELEATGVGAAGGQRQLGLGRGAGEGVPSPGRGGPAAPATQPAGAGLGVSVPSARAPAVGAGTQPAALTEQLGLGLEAPAPAPAAQPTTAPVSAAPAAKKAAPKKPAAEEPAPKKAAPKAEAKEAEKPTPKKAAPKAEPKATVSKKEAPASRKFATQFPTDPTPRDDVRKAAILANSDVKRRPKTSREGEPQSIVQGTAAKAYFSNYARVIDAISAMAYEVAFKSDGVFPGTGASLRGKGKDAKSNAQLAMEWVNNNLSQPTRDLLSQQVNYYVKAAAKMEQLAAQDAVAEGRKLSAAQKRKIREYEKQLAEETNRAAEEKRREVTDEFNALQAVQKIMEMRLDESAVAGLDVPLHPAVEQALSKGDLLGAIQGLAKSHPLQRFRSLANKLASRLGGTKLQIVANLKDAAGNPVAGLFDPKTNTIKLDRDTGLNTHTLMHETAHAVTSANLANKGHPTTQALNKLFNDIKDSLDTAYGAQSLDEFVAEAFSNPEFQYKLQTINLKGDSVNAWTRFVGAVANFLRSLVGLDTKPVTAQDQFFKLVDNILAPSPETRNAGALYLASQSGKGGQILSAAYENAPTWGKQAAESLGDFLSRVDIAEKAKRFILDLTPLNNFADLVKDSLPEAKQLDNIVYKQSAMLAKMLEKTEPTVAKVSKWFKEQGKQTITVDGIQMDKGTALNDAAHVGSYEGVNPTYDESRYKDTEKLEAYRYVKRRYDKLGPEGQAAYRSLLNTYKFFKDQIGESLEIALKDATPNSKSRTALVKELYDRLINEGGIDPYVAFDREGKFWLEYNAIDPRTKQSEYFVEAFDTKAARERAVKELEAQKDKIGLTGLNRFTNIAETDYNKAPPGSFVREILDILEANDVNQETKDSVMRTFLEYLPEKSMAQAFQFRKGPGGKGVRGMRGDITPLSVNMPRHDVVDVLQKRVPALARQISQLRYNREIQKLVSDAEERVRAKGRPDADVRNLEQLQGRAKFVQNPNVANWSKRITSSIFAWTLGANPSSALLQFSQIGLVVAPMLAARPGVGMGKTTTALGNAVRAFMASGTSRKVEMVGPDGDVVERTRAMPSIDNFDFGGPKPEHMSEEYWKKLRVLARVGADHNVLGRSIIQDMVDIEDSRGLAAKLNTGMAFMFHNAEKMNKQVALMMAYEVELAGNKNPSEAQMERAALNAIEFVEIANGSAAQAGAAPIAQNNIGRIAYMYKRYGVSMVYLQLKMMRDAFKGQDPEVRNLAKRQLVATWGAAGLLSGAMGMPFYGVISMVYDAFREDDEDDFDAVMQKAMPPLMARGALNYLTGVDVASRVQMTDLLFREPIIENESFLWEMVMTFGGPAVGLANNFERGVEQILDGNTERGIEAMAPAAMRNVLRSIRYYTEGAETLRGDPVIDDVGFGHAFLQGLGFAPAEYIRKMEINQNAKRIDRKVGEKRSKLQKKYYIALRHGDSEEAANILEDIRRYNARNPDYPITADSLVRSLKGHIRTTQRMHYGVTYSPRLQQRLLDSMEDYEGAVSIWD